MITPEKNDIKLNGLFNWGKEAIIDVNGKDTTFYIRVVGDADLNRARVVAMRKSAELRRRLKDLNSDERIGYVADKDDIDREKLLAYLLLVRSREFYKDAMKDVKLKFPKEPNSEASLEDQENYQLEVDAYPAKLDAEIRNVVERLYEKERVKLDVIDNDTLYKYYVDAIINELCENEMFSKYTELCTCFGIYSDADYKIRYFEDYQEFENLPTDIKKQFIDNYRALELSVEDLKK